MTKNWPLSRPKPPKIFGRYKTCIGTEREDYQDVHGIVSVMKMRVELIDPRPYWVTSWMHDHHLYEAEFPTHTEAVVFAHQIAGKINDTEKATLATSG